MMFEHEHYGLIVILALLAGSVIGLALLWYRVLRRQRGGDLPACAKCGYATRGLTSLHCPECGADLREEGIITPRQRGMVRPAVFVVLWSILLIAPACLVSVILMAFGPTTPYKNESATLHPAKSGGYQSIELEVSGGKHLDTLEVMIIGSTGQVVRSTIDLRVMQYSTVIVTNTHASGSSMSVVTSFGRSTGAVDQAVIVDWLGQAGANPADQAVIAEADELWGIVKATPVAGLQNVGGPVFLVPKTSAWVDDDVAMWFILMQPAIWFLLWLFGIVFYFRIRKRRLVSLTDGAVGA